jgi:hypothetical protein
LRLLTCYSVPRDPILIGRRNLVLVLSIVSLAALAEFFSMGLPISPLRGKSLFAVEGAAPLIADILVFRVGIAMRLRRCVRTHFAIGAHAIKTSLLGVEFG